MTSRMHLDDNDRPLLTKRECCSSWIVNGGRGEVKDETA